MKRTIFLVGWMFLSATAVFAGEREVEVTNVSIEPGARQMGPDGVDNGDKVLHIRLWNKGIRLAKNLDLEIEYYAKDGSVIQTGVVKKVLNVPIEPGVEKNHRVPLARYNKTLFGLLDMKSQGQYPYGRDQDLDGVKVRAQNVKFVWS
ncbi:MAG: hypothetical protein V1882_09920 [Candidatus Omnitrophota bacterium]